MSDLAIGFVVGFVSGAIWSFLSRNLTITLNHKEHKP